MNIPYEYDPIIPSGIPNTTMCPIGRPMELITKSIRRWNLPTYGSVTYAMVPWLLDTDEADVNHKLLSIKTGYILYTIYIKYI